MRILSFILIISLTHFTQGQNVYTKFSDTLVFDDFSSNNYNFPEKYNSLELTIIEEGNYLIKRLKDEGQSVAYLKTDKPLATYQISTRLRIVKDSKNGTGGLILHGQTSTNGGVFIEIDAKRNFRAYKVNGTEKRLLSGTPKANGWLKSKNLTKKDNTVMVRLEDGYFDIYFNDNYSYSIYDTQYRQGNVGIFANASTEVLVNQFCLSKSTNTLPTITSNPENPENTTSDPAFEEVILLFKTKIDLQQKEIATLEKDVNKCRSMLNYDTSLVTKTKELAVNNKFLSNQLDSTSKALTKANIRLTYLESLKEDVEAGSNGDLVLNLSSILAEIKRENSTLTTTNKILIQANSQLKEDNDVLLREIERMKYLLQIQE
ncbi:MAG: hypothetical protein P8N47_07860 [Bacteroidia bacterium]|jgi:hypothetical protein|nr:hypothetical protein [Bacteroidia bacterium]